VKAEYPKLRERRAPNSARWNRTSRDGRTSSAPLLTRSFACPCCVPPTAAHAGGSSTFGASVLMGT